MAELLHFVPQHVKDAQKNLEDFIACCHDLLMVFGKDLSWRSHYWPEAGITFGNLDQKFGKLDPNKVMAQPFLEFAKAYVRYQQGHRPTEAKFEIRALRCLERALLQVHGKADLADLSYLVLDQAAVLAKEHYSAGIAYHVGRELKRLIEFLHQKQLLSGHLVWQSPNKRPEDTVRTGEKARQIREKKLPDLEALDALAAIFSKDLSAHRDILMTSVAAMLLCAPSRISEVLSLPEDCEILQSKKDGKQAYGWRFQPSKGALAGIKWIPDLMVPLAQKAIARVRQITKPARSVALYYEQNPTHFYKHARCPDVPLNHPLTALQAADALDINGPTPAYRKGVLRRYGLASEDGCHTLASLRLWVNAKLPQEFPWLDEKHHVCFSEALFCFMDRQLRTDMPASPILLSMPTVNVFNQDLDSKQAPDGTVIPGIFDRHGYNQGRQKPLKLTSHQFRHLLNTIVRITMNTATNLLQ